ncbi:hypothetical protein NT6N_08030 [Oceaniferula spumae]|uniref:DUF4145 domain-containing protein n=1 Tax=Oceaniferula spumae TaxID=2979115 RepID=A0AAT9FIG6_9BACT
MKHPLGDTPQFEISPEMRKTLSDLGKHMKAVNAQFAEAGAKIAAGIKRINETLPENVRELARHGWFISWWHTPLPALIPVADLFRSGNEKEGNAQLCHHFTEIYGEITKDLLERYPRRAPILQSAFDAHESGSFALSVPVFLAQADGIAREMLGVSVYTRRGNVRKTMQEAIERIDPRGIDEPILRLILEDLPLTASDNSPDFRADSLNRHAILHGNDLDYPSSLNSLKAISWLQYAAQFEETAKMAQTTKVEQDVDLNT